MPAFAHHRQDLQAVWDAVLVAINPALAVERSLRQLASSAADLTTLARTPVLAMGKAAITMAQGLLRVAPDHRAPMLIISPEGITTPPPAHAEVLFSDHPLPTERGQLAAERVLSFIRNLPPNGTSPAFPHLIVLLSGGSSALCTLPHPPLTIHHLHALTTDLIARGVRIDQLNLIRRALDSTKAGSLARALPADCRTLVLTLSDVLSGAPHDIASGPFSPSPTTAADALALLTSLKLTQKHPQIAEFLRDQASATDNTTPLASETTDPFTRVDHRIIASHTSAANAAASALQRLGYTAIVRTGFECSAEAMAREAISAARAASTRRPAAIVFTSEASVASTIAQPGGRARHAAICCIEPLASLAPAALLCIATDGVDGTSALPPTPAGALITHHTARAALIKGFSPINHARRAASDEFFRSLDNHAAANELATTITTGPTGTNVNDLLILLLPEK
jgi:glycerate 2-kinase